MQFNALFFLLVVSCLYLALAQVSYDDCCLKYVKKPSKAIQRFVVKHRWQEADGGCNIPAIVFTTKRGRVFCADPKDKWAVALTHKLDRSAAANGNKQHKHFRRGPKRV